MYHKNQPSLGKPHHTWSHRVGCWIGLPRISRFVAWVQRVFQAASIFRCEIFRGVEVDTKTILQWRKNYEAIWAKKTVCDCEDQQPLATSCLGCFVFFFSCLCVCVKDDATYTHTQRARWFVVLRKNTDIRTLYSCWRRRNMMLCGGFCHMLQSIFYIIMKIWSHFCWSDQWKFMVALDQEIWFQHGYRILLPRSL